MTFVVHLHPAETQEKLDGEGNCRAAAVALVFRKFNLGSRLRSFRLSQIGARIETGRFILDRAGLLCSQPPSIGLRMPLLPRVFSRPFLSIRKPQLAVVSQIACCRFDQRMFGLHVADLAEVGSVKFWCHFCQGQIDLSPWIASTTALARSRQSDRSPSPMSFISMLQRYSMTSSRGAPRRN